jgi:hypothetical protein
MEAHALQVWIKTGDEWKQAAFASSGLPADAAPGNPNQGSEQSKTTGLL